MRLNSGSQRRAGEVAPVAVARDAPVHRRDRAALAVAARAGSWATPRAPPGSRARDRRRAGSAARPTRGRPGSAPHRCVGVELVRHLEPGVRGARGTTSNPGVALLEQRDQRARGALTSPTETPCTRMRAAASRAAGCASRRAEALAHHAREAAPAQARPHGAGASRAGEQHPGQVRSKRAGPGRHVTDGGRRPPSPGSRRSRAADQGLENRRRELPAGLGVRVRARPGCQRVRRVARRRVRRRRVHGTSGPRQWHFLYFLPLPHGRGRCESTLGRARPWRASVRLGRRAARLASGAWRRRRPRHGGAARRPMRAADCCCAALDTARAVAALARRVGRVGRRRSRTAARPAGAVPRLSRPGARLGAAAACCTRTRSEQARDLVLDRHQRAFEQLEALGLVLVLRVAAGRSRAGRCRGTARRSRAGGPSISCRSSAAAGGGRLRRCSSGPSSFSLRLVARRARHRAAAACQSSSAPSPCNARSSSSSTPKKRWKPVAELVGVAAGTSPAMRAHDVAATMATTFSRSSLTAGPPGARRRCVLRCWSITSSYSSRFLRTSKL